MECDIFPCNICDYQDGSVCSADTLKRDLNDLPGCPLSRISKGKPDIGHWVVRQPDGLFCYYDEISGKIERKDMTLQEMIFFRERNCRMSYDLAETDTKSQVEFQVIRWDDIGKNR